MSKSNSGSVAGRGALRAAASVGALLVGLGAASAVASTAAAQDADVLLEQGVEARRAGNDEAALRFFTQANAARPSGVARAQMGLASQALGSWVPAFEHLRAALASDDEFVVRNRAALESALETVQSHVGQLELRSSLSGGNAQVNGRDVGTLPLPGPVTVPIGETVITVRQEGYHRFSRTVQVSSGVISREQVTLVANEAEPAAVLAQPIPRAQEAHPQDPPPQTAVAQGGSDRGAFLGMGVTFSVVAVLGLSLGGGFADAFSQMDSVWASTACQQGPQPERVCPSTLDARNSNEAGMIGSFVAGGASLALAIVFYTLFGTSGSDVETVACGAGPGDLGVGCSAAF